MKKRISPDRIVDAVIKNFKEILTKPLLKNLILVTIAIALADKLKINEIARKLPVDVKRQKSKETRLLRYLNKPFPMLDMMFSWAKPVLVKTGICATKSVWKDRRSYNSPDRRSEPNSRLQSLCGSNTFQEESHIHSV